MDLQTYGKINVYDIFSNQRIKEYERGTLILVKTELPFPRESLKSRCVLYAKWPVRIMEKF